LFLGFGYCVNVRFDLGNQKTQAGVQGFISHSAPVSLFNGFTIEKALSQICVPPNMEHVFIAKSLKQGNCSLLTSFQKAS